VLKALSWVGIVWELGEPPADVVANERKLGTAVVEKVARQLAAAFPAERIAAQLRSALDATPQLDQLIAEFQAARAQALASLSEWSLPHLPTLEEVRAYAERTLADTPSLDQIAERARLLVLEAVCTRLVEEPATA
jgi:stearoyl-CoA desaturase (Delta-9 desaturase)